MNSEWYTVAGRVQPGYQVASGWATDSPYPQGTIEMQLPYFQALGLDLTPYFRGTLNVSIHPQTFELLQPTYTFCNVQWYANSPAEHFSFSPCQVTYQNQTYFAWIYHPHPETKPAHFQDPSTLEIIAPFIPEITYGVTLDLKINSREIRLIGCDFVRHTRQTVG